VSESRTGNACRRPGSRFQKQDESIPNLISPNAVNRLQGRASNFQSSVPGVQFVKTDEALHQMLNKTPYTRLTAKWTSVLDLDIPAVEPSKTGGSGGHDCGAVKAAIVYREEKIYEVSILSKRKDRCGIPMIIPRSMKLMRGKRRICKNRT